MNKLIIVFALCCLFALAICDDYGHGGYGKDGGYHGKGGYGKSGGGGGGGYGHGHKHYDGKAEVYMKKKPYGFDYYLKEHGQSYGGGGYDHKY